MPLLASVPPLCVPYQHCGCYSLKHPANTVLFWTVFPNCSQMSASSDAVCGVEAEGCTSHLPHGAMNFWHVQIFGQQIKPFTQSRQSLIFEILYLYFLHYTAANKANSKKDKTSNRNWNSTTVKVASIPPTPPLSWVHKLASQHPTAQCGFTSHWYWAGTEQQTLENYRIDARTPHDMVGSTDVSLLAKE